MQYNTMVCSLTTIGLAQIQKVSTRISGIPHNLLNLLLAQNPILLAIVRLNDHDSDTAHPQEIPHLKRMTGHGMLPISEQPTRARMPTEGLGGGHDPEALAVGGDQELTGAGIGELVPLELAADGGGVLGPEVVGVGAISLV